MQQRALTAGGRKADTVCTDAKKASSYGGVGQPGVNRAKRVPCWAANFAATPRRDPRGQGDWWRSRLTGDVAARRHRQLVVGGPPPLARRSAGLAAGGVQSLRTGLGKLNRAVSVVRERSVTMIEPSEPRASTTC